MRRKISTNDLEINMYVTDLDRPWNQAPFEPPFEFQGFKVSSDDELTKVRKLCEYVYIDPKFGKEAKNYLPDSYGLKDITQVFVSLSSSANTGAFSDETPLEKEIPMARKVLESANDMYNQVVIDIQQGNRISEGDLEQSVSGLVSSINRNPSALTWLTGQQGNDSLGYVSPVSITALALTVGRAMRLPMDVMESLATATLFQDIGMLRMPAEIVNKKEPLTRTEKDILKGHVDASVKMLGQAGDFPSTVIQIIQQHHERRDGSGYPRGAAGDDISALAAISGVSDSYQSATKDRPHRKGKTSFQALTELYGDRGNNFEKSVVEQFIQCIGIFPVGSFVELNTKEVAVVVNRHPEKQLKPTVRLVVDADGERIADPPFIDLANQGGGDGATRLITRVIDPSKHNLDVTGILA